MGLAWLRARSEWRRRWPSLLALTLLVSLVGAVTLATFAGARRTRSSVDRFVEATRTLDSFLFFEGESLEPAERIAALDEVSAAAPIVGVAAYSESQPGVVFLIASPDGAFGDTVVRDLVVAGRRARPDVSTEVAVPESVAGAHSLAVGDRWVVHTVSRRQSLCFVGGEGAPPEDECAALFPLFAGETDEADVSVLDGPVLDLEVVGITRGPFDLGQAEGSASIVVLGPALYDEIYDDIPPFPGLAVRYAPGVSDVEFERAVAGVVDRALISDFEHSSTSIEQLQTTADVFGTALLVFSLVAGGLGLVAITQALARHVAGSERERDVLRGFGMGRGGRSVDAAAPLLPVALAGALGSVLGAWAISPLMPIASARKFEPVRGLSFDAGVLVGGALVVVVLVLSVALLAAAFTRASPRRGPVLARWVRRGGVGSSLGLHFALDPGRARRAIPVRTAVAGAALGVVGVVAVATFGASLTRLTDEPRRYGYGFDAWVSGCTVESGCDPSRVGEQDAAVADIDGVDAAVRLWYSLLVSVEGRSETGWGQRGLFGSAGIPIVAGRAPATDGEVALGSETMDRHGVGIGDRLEVEGRELEVVGQAVFPAAGDNFPLADGVLFEESGLLALGLLSAESPGNASVAVRLHPSADRAAVLARLTVVNEGFAPETPIRGSEVDDLARIRALPTVLAAFLILVALLAVGHAVFVTVRRRAPDLAIVRTMGLTPRGVAGVVRWQASTLAALGLLLGIPIGLLLGRLVWDRVADSYGVADDPAWPWLALVIVPVATVLVVNVLAWFPARRAAQLRTAEILRTE